jgi:hypothetical protein
VIHRHAHRFVVQDPGSIFKYHCSDRRTEVHLPPKTPDELNEQIEKQNVKPSREGKERTAEGLSVDTPKAGDFFANLEKVSERERGSKN